MPNSKNINTRDDYKHFLRSLEVVGIALVESKFQIDRRKYFDDADEKIGVEFECDIINTKSSSFDVIAKMTLKSRSEKKEGSLTLHASYALHFHTTSNVVKSFVQRFAESEARLVAWPYFREFVTSMCGRAQVPPITLPMVGSERRPT